MSLIFCTENLAWSREIVISPFFKKYPLQAKKKYDFELWAEAVDIMYMNKRRKANVQKGLKGFSKNNWNKQDLARMIELHSLMQKYKSDRPQGLKHIDVAYRELHSNPDKK